jgi:TonB family protein
MNRLQKKCLVAAAGTHLLIVVAVLCSGFITSKPKVDDSQVLDVIPPNLIDAAFNSGVKGAKPPPPAPPVKPPEPQQPQQEPPKQPVKIVEPPTPPEKIQPEDEKPVVKPEIEKPKPKEHVIKPDLTVVKRDKPKVVDNSAAEAEKAAKEAAKEAKRLANERAKAFQHAANSIRENTSAVTTTVFGPTGDSTAAVANYATIVKSVYTQAWIPPEDTASDDANVKVSVTIANDGRVISAHIIDRSGDTSVDRSVQKTLDRVHDIAPFPDGSTDRERTYIINFNLKAKRMLG